MSAVQICGGAGLGLSIEQTLANRMEGETCPAFTDTALETGLRVSSAAADNGERPA